MAYVPPKGAAPEYKGVYSKAATGMEVPMKGSQIKKSVGGNPDREKVLRLAGMEKSKESLRGKS